MTGTVSRYGASALATPPVPAFTRGVMLSQRNLAVNSAITAETIGGGTAADPVRALASTRRRS